MSQPKIQWIIPVDTQDPDRNVWVMISKGKADKNSVVQSVRVFTKEPHDATIDYEVQQFSASHHDVEVTVLEVALDYFDPGEIGFTPC